MAELPKREIVQSLHYSVELGCPKSWIRWTKNFDISEKYKLKIPEVSTTFDSTVVTIWKVDLLSSYADTSDNEKIILEYIIKNGSITKMMSSKILS